LTEDETTTVLQISFADLFEEFNSVEGRITDLKVCSQHVKLQLEENIAEECDS